MALTTWEAEYSRDRQETPVVLAFLWMAWRKMVARGDHKKVRKIESMIKLWNAPV